MEKAAGVEAGNPESEILEFLLSGAEAGTEEFWSFPKLIIVFHETKFHAVEMLLLRDRED